MSFEKETSSDGVKESSPQMCMWCVCVCVFLDNRIRSGRERERLEITSELFRMDLSLLFGSKQRSVCVCVCVSGYG